MGKVEAFSLPGYDIFFLSRDHVPPHIHIERPGKWEIRVEFLSCTEKDFVFTVKYPEGFTPSSSIKRLLLEHIVPNKDKLLEEWEKKVCRE